MSVDETLMCSFQLLKPANEQKAVETGLNGGAGIGQARPKTPPKTTKVTNSDSFL